MNTPIPQSLMERRTAAYAYLHTVVDGAPVKLLSKEEEKEVTSAVMRSLVPSLAGGTFSAEEAVSFFKALLAHPNLSPETLERLALDGLMSSPEILEAFLKYPSLERYLILEAGITAWTQLDTSRNLPKTGALAEMHWSASFRDRQKLFAEVLEGAGPIGKLAAFLLKAGWTYDKRGALAVSTLLAEEDLTVLETAATFLTDSNSKDISDILISIDRAKLVLTR